MVTIKNKHTYVDAGILMVWLKIGSLFPSKHLILILIFEMAMNLKKPMLIKLKILELNSLLTAHFLSLSLRYFFSNPC